MAAPNMCGAFRPGTPPLWLVLYEGLPQRDGSIPRSFHIGFFVTAQEAHRNAAYVGALRRAYRQLNPPSRPTAPRGTPTICTTPHNLALVTCSACQVKSTRCASSSGLTRFTLMLAWRVLRWRGLPTNEVADDMTTTCI